MTPMPMHVIEQAAKLIQQYRDLTWQIDLVRQGEARIEFRINAGPQSVRVPANSETAKAIIADLTNQRAALAIKLVDMGVKL